ncbi:MAG: hypothetical protein EON60_06365 [Alphaproteobacteria bacterium]|nr:MAG: hypothetical protein EON60_06365 [Alphaproteobacteria bacterium]
MMTLACLGFFLMVAALIGGIMWAEKGLPAHLKEGYTPPAAPPESAPQSASSPLPRKEPDAHNDNGIRLGQAA